MHDDKSREDGPDGQATGQVGPETRTTASSGPSCERCDRPLTGRKTRFCSDACRMADRREQQQGRRLELMGAIDAAVEELRADLGGSHD